MKRYDQIVGLIWLALGSAMAIEAVRLGLGGLHLPGIGFTAFLIGVSLGFSGLVLTVSATSKDKEGNKVWAGQNWGNVMMTLLALLIYIFLMEPLGFLLATFLLLFVLFKITSAKKWFSPLLSSLTVVFWCYLIFFVWLKVPLPKGILGLG